MNINFPLPKGCEVSLRTEIYLGDINSLPPNDIELIETYFNICIEDDLIDGFCDVEIDCKILDVRFDADYFLSKPEPIYVVVDLEPVDLDGLRALNLSLDYYSMFYECSLSNISTNSNTIAQHDKYVMDQQQPKKLPDDLFKNPLLGKRGKSELNKSISFRIPKDLELSLKKYTESKNVPVSSFYRFCLKYGFNVLSNYYK